jgi:Ser/Thr protein kinase RdoA (MazF antagonist)
MSAIQLDVGPLLTTKPPEIPDEQALYIAKSAFGLSGRLKKLTSERDANFLLRAADGRGYVVKFTNAMEPEEQTDFQTQALLHLEKRAPELNVSRVIRTLSGEPWIPVANTDGCKARVLTFLDGDIEASLPKTPQLARYVAIASAHLNRALKDFHHPGADHELLWDIKHAASLRLMLDAIDDPEQRQQVEAVIDTFEESIAPKLPALPWQVIHGDLNPHNLVFTDDKDLPVGILDFGDMVRTPRICEVAITAGYHTDMANALTSVGEFLALWHGIDPLTEAEVALLPGLIAARFATTITIGNWRAQRYPENRDYILRNLPNATEGIRQLAKLNADQLVEQLLKP